MSSAEYVVVGSNNSNPSCCGGVACALGICRNASMAGARVVLAADHSVHRGSFLFMIYPAHPSNSVAMPAKGGTAPLLLRSPQISGTLSAQACRPLFNRSLISASSFSSAEGPEATTTGFLKRFTCLMTMKRQKAIMRNSITVLINMP
jgi:hypothetical protein